MRHRFFSILIAIPIFTFGGSTLAPDLFHQASQEWDSPSARITAPLAQDEKDFRSRLFSPTQITKFGELYFIVDCWHHRIIFSKKLDAPLNEWKSLDDDIAGPHSLASDGSLYVTEDTGRGRVFVYRQKNEEEFERVQTIEGIGVRPHRTLYDATTDRFYVLSSQTQEIFVFKKKEGALHLEVRKPLPFLEGKYTRSMSIIDGRMYFIPGGSQISEVNYQDLSFDLLRQYPVPREWSELGNDIARIGSYYYLSFSNKRFIRTKRLEDLPSGNFEDLSALFGFHGHPYYLSKIDERYFIPSVIKGSAIHSFTIDSRESLRAIQKLFEFKTPSDASMNRLSKHSP